MEPPARLILVPQLPISMRYQEWWRGDLVHHLHPSFQTVVVLGASAPIEAPRAGFSVADAAVKNELRQMRQYVDLQPTDRDVLLHCDLSYPGLFHNVLFQHRPGRAVVICHASALNRYDIWQPVRKDKWAVERAHAKLYDAVLVATHYHKRKINLPNTVVMGGLPNPPDRILPFRSDPPVPVGMDRRTIMFGSTARPSLQKVTLSVEAAVEKLTEERVHRDAHYSWDSYYRFLDRCEFLLVTAKEETYGYQVVDAVLRGCIPIAPRAYSYPELLPDDQLYDNDASPEVKAQQIQKIVKATRGRTPLLKCAKSAHQFYPTLLRALRGC